MLRRTGRALVGVLLSSLVATPALVACGEDGEEPEPLIFWAVTMAPRPIDDERVLGEALVEFTARTGIPVELEVIGWLDLYPRIEVALSSGEGPDVLNIGNTWSVALSEAGALLSLDDEAMAAIGGRDRFLETALAASGREGHPPASVPYLGQAYGIYYHREAFAEAGISAPPSTWREFAEVARRLTGQERWGVAFAGAEWTSNAHLAFILSAQRGGSLLDDAGRPRFDTPAIRGAVEEMVGWMGVHRVIDPALAGEERVRDLAQDLVDGDVAMMIAPSGLRSNLAALGFDDYGVAPLPTSDGRPGSAGTVRSIVGGTNLALWAGTDRRQDALQLVDFLTSADQQVTLNQAFGTLPVVSDVYDDPAFDDERLQTFLSVFRDASLPMPAHAEEGRMERVLGGAIADLWQQAAETDLTPDQVRAALAAADRTMADR